MKEVSTTKEKAMSGAGNGIAANSRSLEQLR